MSASGILFAVFTAASYTFAATDKVFLGFVMSAISILFGLAAVYHDEQQLARIAKLEKELHEMRKDVDDG